MEETMRPTTAFDDNVFDLNALLHPGKVFDHPKDVVAHPALSNAKKRAILLGIGCISDCFLSRTEGTHWAQSAGHHR
jgi:hypothetical protein